MQKITVFLLVIIISFLSSVPLFAQWMKFEQVIVSFKIKNAGINVDGRFGNAKGSGKFDEKDLSKSYFLGVVEPHSVQTGIKMRDKHLKEKSEFFDVQKFPSIEMKSVKIELESAQQYRVTWDLTMKGITLRFKSSMTAVQENGKLILQTTFKLNRKEWKVGGNSITMSDVVSVQLRAVMTK
ncbi:MAG: YceI family protein [Bacteroidetes bacterium]|nr:YceI family protein [Bacteroidota bacterium]